MCKEICPRCEFIKEGREVDNDGYYYEECPECGFKHYEEDFCRKCLKIYDYSYEDSDYCEECYDNVEKYILEKYRSNHLKDEVVANTKQFVDYFLTRKIENPFEI